MQSFFCHQVQDDRLEMELCSQSLLKSCLDYMCDYLPHIHAHPNFFHYAHRKLNINIILKDYEHIAITFRKLKVIRVFFIFRIQNKRKECNPCWGKVVMQI